MKKINGIRITVVEDKEAMSRLAARLVLARVKSKPRINILTPTGTTPEGVYEILRKKNPRIWRKATFFIKDEYCERVGGKIKLISEKDPRSYRFYIKDRLSQYVHPIKVYCPGTENIRRPGYFDGLVKKLGGIDLAIGAMGEDGHMGFNFPSSGFNSVTRLVKLNANIKKVNRKLTGHKIPELGITVGIKTEMQSREILFLVTGERKAKILARVVNAKKPTKRMPATVMKLHPNCRFIADKAAASMLRLE
jgi:glucosamine-6-phosphate deaminase